jgi:hypothetical protein
MKNVFKKILPRSLISCLKAGIGSLGYCLEHIPKNAMIFSDHNRQIFFGYHDVTPFSVDDKLILAMQAPQENVSPHQCHPDLIIGYYSLEDEKIIFHPVGSTKTWNWQQGCRLQWYPKDSADTRSIIYNTLVDEHYGAVVQDVNSKEVVYKLSRPIYDVSADGRYALSLDFDLLHQCRPGYGYNNLSSSVAKGESDIFLLDIRNGDERIPLSLEEAAGYQPHADMKDAVHYFNHLSFSPTALRFIVTHLWVTPSGRRKTRIITINLSDGSLQCPNNTGQTSHYCWVDDDNLIIFGAHEDGIYQYYLYDLNSSQRKIIGKNNLRQDGHPTIINRSYMITDTYPNNVRLQYLLGYDLVSSSLSQIAKFYVPPNYVGEVRCDLHPRLNRAGDMVCVDIVRDGSRALCLLKLQSRD